MNISHLNNFIPKCKTCWFEPMTATNGYFNIVRFTYNLSQFTPSVYAIIQFVIESSDVDKFDAINKLDIKDRKLEITFDDRVYDMTNPKQEYFNGPFKFICINHTVTTITNVRLVTLHCVDEIFYKMARVNGEKFESYSNMPISAVVDSIVNHSGGKMHTIIDTNLNHRWLQTKMTDYELIRSLLPYASSDNDDDLYTFFMFNNEGYFAPIGTNKTKPIVIPANNVIGMADDISESSNRQLIDQYGSLDNLYSTNHGFIDYNNIKPTKMNMQAVREREKSAKQLSGSSANTYVYTSMDDNNLQKVFLKNLRHRVHTFNRLIKLNCYAIPDLTPLDCVKILNLDKSTIKSDTYDGTYYILSVTYNYGVSTVNTDPTMALVLCSEANTGGGTTEMEGQPIVKSPQNTKSVSGSGAAKNAGVTNTTKKKSTSSKNTTKSTTKKDKDKAVEDAKKKYEDSVKKFDENKPWKNKSDVDINRQLTDTYKGELTFKKTGLVKSDAELSDAKEITTRKMEACCSQKQIKTQYDKYGSTMKHLTGYSTYEDYKKHRSGVQSEWLLK